MPGIITLELLTYCKRDEINNKLPALAVFLTKIGKDMQINFDGGHRGENSKT